MNRRQREVASRLRQELGELLRELAAGLAEVQRHEPLVKGSLYGRRRRRRDGSWGYTQAVCFSHQGHTQHVPLDGKAPHELREALNAYRRFRRARAQMCKRWAVIRQRIDQLESARRLPLEQILRPAPGTAVAGPQTP